MAVLKYYDGSDWEPVVSALQGPTGPTGATGVATGLPTGGVTGAVLAKTSTTDYATQWSVLDYSGAWTSFTPTLFQNAGIAITANGSRYKQIGTTMFVHISLDANGNGTGNNIVYIEGLPGTRGTSDGMSVGSGRLYDISANVTYGFISELATRSGNSGFTMSGDWATGGAWGNSPSLALGTGDRIDAVLTYEVV